VLVSEAVGGDVRIVHHLLRQKGRRQDQDTRQRKIRFVESRISLLREQRLESKVCLANGT
jgi:plasmid replication initiation protein